MQPRERERQVSIHPQPGASIIKSEGGEGYSIVRENLCGCQIKALVDYRESSCAISASFAWYKVYTCVGVCVYINAADFRGPSIIYTQLCTRYIIIRAARQTLPAYCALIDFGRGLCDEYKKLN